MVSQPTGEVTHNLQVDAINKFFRQPIIVMLLLRDTRKRSSSKCILRIEAQNIDGNLRRKRKS